MKKSGRQYGYSYCPEVKHVVFNPTLALQNCRKYQMRDVILFDRKNNCMG